MAPSHWIAVSITPRSSSAIKEKLWQRVKLKMVYSRLILQMLNSGALKSPSFMSLRFPITVKR